MKHHLLTLTVVIAIFCCWLCGCDHTAPAADNTPLREAYNRAYKLQNRGEYQQAMHLYMETENPARQSGDEALVGDIYSRIGELHTYYYDYPQALASFHRAYDAYLLCEDTVAQNSTLFSIAQCYSAMGKAPVAEMMYVLIYNWAVLNNNEPLEQLCEKQIAERGSMFDNIETLRQISLPKRAASVDTPDLSAAEEYASLSLLLPGLDDNRDGYPYKKFRQMRPDTIVYNPMNKVQVEYLRKLSDMRMAQLEQEQTIRLLTMVIAGTVIVLLVIIVIYQRRLRKATVDNYMVEVQTLQQRLHSSESQISVMNDKILHSSASAEQMSKQINSLFKQQFALLDSLVNTYYETRDINRDKEAIYKKVKGEIAKLSSRESIAELEAIINRHRGGIIAAIRQKYPSLSEQNITLLCYILAGFSAKSIGILLDCSIANVHTKRSRLKRQLLDLDAASGEKFAELLA